MKSNKKLLVFSGIVMLLITIVTLKSNEESKRFDFLLKCHEIESGK